MNASDQNMEKSKTITIADGMIPRYQACHVCEETRKPEKGVVTKCGKTYCQNLHPPGIMLKTPCSPVFSHGFEYSSQM